MTAIGRRLSSARVRRVDPARSLDAVEPCGVRVATGVYSSANARTAAAKASPRAA